MKVTFEEKQRRRAAAAKERAERDREREARRLAALPAPVVIPEERVLARIMERRWMPDTPETEDEARRLDMGRQFNDYQLRETAVSRACYRAMQKDKIVTTRQMRPPGEVEVSPAARAALAQRIKVEGGEYVLTDEKGGPGVQP